MQRPWPTDRSAGVASVSWWRATAKRKSRSSCGCLRECRRTKRTIDRNNAAVQSLKDHRVNMTTRIFRRAPQLPGSPAATTDLVFAGELMK